MMAGSPDLELLVEKEIEKRKCRSSVMAYRVGSWIFYDEYYGEASVEERITEEIMKMGQNRLHVTEVKLYKSREGKEHSARITFGSIQQKNVFYSALAKNARKPSGTAAKAVSFRDCFSVDQLQQAKTLYTVGKKMKTKGDIASFRVVARGQNGEPRLEVRREDRKWRKMRRKPDQQISSHEDLNKKEEERRLNHDDDQTKKRSEERKEEERKSGEENRRYSMRGAL